MADERVVLSNVLCFLVNKYGNIDTKTLKLVLSDFYTADVLSAAKLKLLEAVDSLKLSSKRPHISQRRDASERLSREVDDLFTLVTFLDEQKCLDQIPTYVSDSSDHMPSVRLYEGDLYTVMTMLRDFAGKLDQYGGVLAAIAKDVRDLQVSSTATPAGQMSVGYPPLTGAPSLAVQSAEYRCVQSAGVIAGNSRGNENESRSAGADWAAIACMSTSTPYNHGNRFAALTTDDDGDSADGRPFTVVDRRRPNKRARQQSSPSQATITQLYSTAAAATTSCPPCSYDLRKSF